MLEHKTASEKFNEKKFHDQFWNTLEVDGPQKALSYLLDNAPAMLTSSLARQEKLNNVLYLSKVIQNHGITKHGLAKSARKFNTVWDTWARWGSGKPGTFVDFGCGTHDPIALSAFMYGGGFNRALANDMSAPRNSSFSAMSMADILSVACTQPGAVVPPAIDADIFASRIRGFDIKALSDGKLDEAIVPMRGRVDYAVCDIVDAPLADQEASMIVSYAVFEHVMDIPGVLKYLFAKTAPNGIGQHFIDMNDHRAHRKDGAFTPFDFLTERKAAGNVNRVRLSGHLDAFRAAGFEVLQVLPKQEPLPADVRARLTPEFSNMSIEDLETVSVRIVVKRPA